MDENKLADALNNIAAATNRNTELLEKFVKWSWQEEKVSFEEMKKNSTLVKQAFYTVQSEEVISGKKTYKNLQTFETKKLADEYLINELKGKWRTIMKIKYLSSNQIENEKQKGTDNGESVAL